MAISNRVGPPVTGEDFFGRTHELARAHSYLDSRHSLVLSAPRRIGKSSFAKKLIEEKKAQNWTCVYIDLEGIQSREEFLNSLLNGFEKSGIWTKAANRAGNALNKIIEGIKEVGPVKLDFARDKDIESIYSSLAEAFDHTKDTLIVIDELTLFLSCIARNDNSSLEVAFLLNWFRSLRQVADSKIRWIFCGSVGLHNFTNMNRLSMTINDMFPFDFDALSPIEAKELVKALGDAEGMTLPEDIIDYMLEKIGWSIPYFIQLIFSNLKEYHQFGYKIDKSFVDKAFQTVVETETLSTWSERLAEYNGYEDAARLMLNALSQSEAGLTKSQLMALILSEIENNPTKEDILTATTLNMLQHDGYIVRGKGGIRRFRSPLLKEWWHYHFVE